MWFNNTSGGGVVTVCVVLRLPLTSASDGNLLPAPKTLLRFPQIPPSHPLDDDDDVSQARETYPPMLHSNWKQIFFLKNNKMQ